MPYIMDSPTEGRRIERKTDNRLTGDQLRWAGVHAGQKVLDVGCAAGTTCRLLAEMVGSDGAVVGIDSSPGRIAEAGQHPAYRSTIDYRIGMAEELPAADGEFDLSWARFLFEYLPDPSVALKEMVRITKPGGTVAVADLDGNCIWHYPYPASLAGDLEQAVATLRRHGFDPLVGRKLFHLAWGAGLEEITVDVRPYHLIAGGIQPEIESLWDHKLRTVSETLARLGWSAERARGFRQGLMAHFRDPGSFTYRVLITVKGKRPDTA
jgi:SAM-dependent methyltransferase